MSTIKLTRKASCISTQNNPNPLDKAPITNVAIVVTQSLASELDMDLYPELSKEQALLSKLCIVVSTLNTNKKDTDGECSQFRELGEHCGYFRQVPMEESSHSFTGMDGKLFNHI